MNKRSVFWLLAIFLAACSDNDNDRGGVATPEPPPPTMNVFSEFARQVFSVDENGTPVEVDGGAFVQDATDDSFADLLP